MALISAMTTADPRPIPRETPAVCNTAGAVSSLTVALEVMACVLIIGVWVG